MMNSRQDDPSQPSPLTTHIGYITGPRAEQPLGVRVVEPPPNTRQAQRGSLYTVLELFGDHPDRNAIADRLLIEVQRVYYSAKGSQSQVMVEAVQQAQQLLREVNAHTPHYPLQFGLVACALLGGRLLLAASGSAFALIRVSDKVHMFPSDPSATLGGYGAAPVEVYRQDVQADDALFLGGGGWLQRVPSRTLASIVAFTNAENCNDAADELYEQTARMPIPGLLIVLSADQEPPRSGGFGPSGGRPSAPGGQGPAGGQGPRRSRFGGLPTALGTSPPARVPPVTGELPGAAPVASIPHRESSAAPFSESTPAPIPRNFVERAAPTEPQPATFPPESPVVPEVEPHAGVVEPAHLDTEADLPAAPSVGVFDTPEVTPPSALPPAAQTHPPREPGTEAAELPEEPGEDVEPIFPPPPLPVEAQVPRGPSVFDQARAKTGAGLRQARDWVARMLPERQTKSTTTVSWETAAVDQPTLDEDEAIVEPDPREANRRERQARQAAVARRAREVEQRMAAAPVREPPPAHHPAAPLPEGQADEFAPAPPMPVLEMSPFAPPAPARGARARLFLLIALLLVISVPVVVAAVNYSNGNNRRAQADEYTARAEFLLVGAQAAMDQGDKVVARERLTEAKDALAQAIELDGTNEQRDALVATIESELQTVLQVIPLYGLTEPLITFPAEARPQRVLVINESIFVIDSGRAALFRYRYDPATGTVGDQLGQVVLQEGAAVDNTTVGTLVDMAWLPLIPGFEDRPSLLVTDRNNNVFRYDERVEGATVMQFADRAQWGSLGQIQTYNGRIYVADEAKGSILRYNPGQFQLPGEPWFAPETQVNLAGLLALEIDGDIWTLFSNGMILRYRDRQQLPFSPEQSIGLAEEPVDMYVSKQDSSTVYLVDAGEDRILVYDKSGAYVGQLRAPEGDMLAGLSGLYVDEVGGTMYILTQSGLFAHPLLP